MNKPNFFIIGAPKCGTTSLAHYLSEHPLVCMSDPKEPHYFSPDIWFQNYSLVDYLKCFSKAKGNHISIGEASVFYFYSKVALKQIIEFNPESKFIVMIRNPIDLVYSLHEQLYVTGDENIKDFNVAWELQDTRKNGNKLPAEKGSVPF